MCKEIDMGLQLTIIDTPNNTFTLVGDVPIKLTKLRTAIKSDFLAGRVKQRDDGTWIARHIPSFGTLEEAVRHCHDNEVFNYKISLKTKAS